MKFTVPSSLRSDVEEITAYYNVAFPSMQMVEALPGETADLTFDTDMSNCPPGAVGCYAPVFSIWYGDAWWVGQAMIYVGGAPGTPSTRQAIAHEIGHLYGLDENYVRNGDATYCNDADPPSVMDAAGCDGFPVSPTSFDQGRINAYWSAQRPTIVRALPIGGAVDHIWRAGGYTEVYAWYNAEYFNGNGFVPYDQAPLPQDRIIFKWMDWRTAFSSITTFPQVRGAPASLHRLCLTTYSWGVDGYSEFTCKEYNVSYSDGPTGNWKLDDGSGMIASDTSGFQNNGTLLPSWPLGPTWVNPGRIGGGLSLDGSDDYVEMPSSITLNVGTGDFTISLWLRPDSDAGCCRVVLSKTNSYTVDYWESLGPTYLRLFFFNGEGHHYLVRTQIPFSWTGGWDHVVWVISRANGATLYMNGQVVPTTEFNPANRTANIDSSNSLRLGTYADQGWKYKGRMDEMRLYKRALSASEVSALYTNP